MILSKPWLGKNERGTKGNREEEGKRDEEKGKREGREKELESDRAR